MLSFTKSFVTFPSQIPCAYQHPSARSLVVTRSSSDNDNYKTGSGSTLPPVGPTITPPADLDAVEIRFKRGSRKRKRKQEQDGGSASKQAPIRKDWDSMSLTEKTVEMYMGEKGLLFWLNKLAYASIFIVIGGWILFRFVGPALNLYQLDTPPISPASMFKG